MVVQRTQRRYRLKRVDHEALPSRRLRRRPLSLLLVSSGHLVTVAVALGTVATSLPDGSYSVEARAVLAIGVWWIVVLGLLLRLFPRAPVSNEAILLQAAASRP